MPKSLWKNGRGAMGRMAPLLGQWVAEEDSKLGPVRVELRFALAAGNTTVVKQAIWWLRGKKSYEEIAVFCKGDEAPLEFVSFTSDGRRSEGRVTADQDAPSDALVFQAQMPAGLARMLYWKETREGFHWAVESRGKKGWNRFIQHHYLPLAPSKKKPLTLFT